MDEAFRASDTPIAADVVEGETYYWCSCGLSEKQPFCDGSHDGSGFTPLQYTADKSGTVYFCGCKATMNKPLCDGSHSN